MKSKTTFRFFVSAAGWGKAPFTYQYGDLGRPDKRGHDMFGHVKFVGIWLRNSEKFALEIKFGSCQNTEDTEHGEEWDHLKSEFRDGLEEGPESKSEKKHYSRWGQQLREELMPWPMTEGDKQQSVLSWKPRRRACQGRWREWTTRTYLSPALSSQDLRRLLLLPVAYALEVQRFTVQKDLTARGLSAARQGVTSFEGKLWWSPSWETGNWAPQPHITVTASHWLSCIQTS